jgi:hypothetical protein
VNAVPMVMPEAITMPRQKRAAGAGTLGEQQRDHREHQRGGSHQHRAQADAGGLLDGLALGQALLLQLVGELRMPCLEITPIRVTRPTWV